MKTFLEMTNDQRREKLAQQQKLYEIQRSAGLDLDMSRGKPDAHQLNLSMDMLAQNPYDLIYTRKGTDVRNYGELNNDGVSYSKMVRPVLELSKSADITKLA